MKKFNKLLQLLLVTILLASCSSEPKTLTDEEIINFVGDKDICYIRMNSSDVLEIDFPSRISMMFAENGEAFFQRLNVEDKKIQSPSKEKSAMVEKYAPKKYDDLMDFDFAKAISNAQDFINKEGNNSLNYTISSLSIYSYKDKFLRTITFQATPKEGGTETNLIPGRRIQTTRNYYEFKFKILEDSQVNLME